MLLRQFRILNTSSKAQKSLLSCQVCPDKKIHPSTLEHHVPNSQQEGSFIRWNCFVPHLLPVSTAWLHTHMMSNTVGSALYLLIQLALMCCKLFSHFGNQPRCTVLFLRVQGNHCQCATELPVPVQWLFVWNCHASGLVPHTLFRLYT